MKGFLGGVSIGAIVAVVGAAMWSLSTPLPNRVEVASDTPDTASQPVEDSNTQPLAEERRDADLVEVAPTSPQASDQTDPSPLATLDMSSGTRPEIGEVEGTATGDISAGEQIAGLPQTSDTVVAEQPGSAGPDAPEGESDVVVSTETVAPPAVEAPEVLAEAEVELQQSDEQDERRAESAASEGSETEALASVAASSPDAPATPTLSPSISGPEIGSAPEATPQPSFARSAAPREQVNTTTEEVGVAEADAPQTSETETEVTASLPTTQSSERGPQIGTPVVPLTERGASSSLIGSSSDQEEVAAVTTVSQRGKPFVVNAQSYEVLDDRPLMSIVLIDDEAAIGAEALAEFPYPLTFAIDPDDPKAVEKMQARRTAGFEVLILADLPREAAPQDAETTMAVWMEQLPQAVGFLEGIETGFQGNRALADQMVAVMQDSGYGMVTQNSGLNTVQKLALRDGMPSGVVFRDFDGAGQNPRAIRRFLDQAAFRARQEGAVIMLGRLRPDTISALLLWGLQDRASQVGLAPVSAGLKANLTPEG